MEAVRLTALNIKEIYMLCEDIRQSDNRDQLIVAYKEAKTQNDLFQNKMSKNQKKTGNFFISNCMTLYRPMKCIRNLVFHHFITFWILFAKYFTEKVIKNSNSKPNIFMYKSLDTVPVCLTWHREGEGLQQ